MQKVRVRYAPSPTGHLHIGNARSALFNYLFAKHYNGSFIIRIEDTDIARNVAGGEQSQFDNLSWLGIDCDEGPQIGGMYGPYRQLERLEFYKKYAQILLDEGLAYKDYKPNSKKYAIRFKVPQDRTYQFDDLIRGQLTFQSKEIEDWIIVKDNGIPTYNFAVVIDDYLMEITHVLRGEEHITNTPKQIMIYQAFNWEPPKFGHMAIIDKKKNKKLSKRDTDVVQFINDYRQLGYLPQALFNFIALLGYSPKGDEEILNQNELISQFDQTRLSKAPAMFDVKKLNYINSRYIKTLSDEELVDLCKPFLVNAGIKIISDEWLLELLLLFKERLTYGAQIVELYHRFFNLEYRVNTNLLDNVNKEVTFELLTKLKKLNHFDHDTIESTIRDVSTITLVKGKPLYLSLRIAITGEETGPNLITSVKLLGLETVISRLTYILSIL
jgi:glutamyl-tRNA synthetase/nondiscriminating glutamyl-tRNA synthetase